MKNSVKEMSRGEVMRRDLQIDERFLYIEKQDSPFPKLGAVSSKGLDRRFICKKSRLAFFNVIYKREFH